MDISVEISKYPLQDDYLNGVDDFLNRLHQHSELKIQVNCLSTQIFGPADIVFPILQKEILRSFENGQSPFVLKILKGDLSEMPIKDYWNDLAGILLKPLPLLAAYFTPFYIPTKIFGAGFLPPYPLYSF